MKKLRSLSILLPIILFSGCVSYPVRFNGYLSPDAKQSAVFPAGSTFWVLDEKDPKNQLLSEEIKRKINSLLREKGYRSAPYEEATVFLAYSYAINPGIISGIRPETHPSEIGTINTFTENGRVRTSFISFPGYTTYVPYKYTVYTSTLQLQALDAKSLRDTKQQRSVWIGDAALTSQNPDLRETVNYLLVETFGHFGQDTKKSISDTFSPKDPQVKRLSE